MSDLEELREGWGGFRSLNLNVPSLYQNQLFDKFLCTCRKFVSQRIVLKN